MTLVNGRAIIIVIRFLVDWLFLKWGNLIVTGRLDINQASVRKELSHECLSNFSTLIVDDDSLDYLLFYSFLSFLRLEKNRSEFNTVSIECRSVHKGSFVHPFVRCDTSVHWSACTHKSMNVICMYVCMHAQ